MGVPGTEHSPRIQQRASCFNFHAIMKARFFSLLYGGHKQIKENRDAFNEKTHAPKEVLIIFLHKFILSYRIV
jgi:hypothetical protein